MQRSLLLCCVVLFSLHAVAQSADHFQIFGGYSLIGYSVYNRYSGPSSLLKFNGWDASFTARIAPHFLLEADSSGGFTPIFSTLQARTFTYMGGPRVFLDRDKTTLYAHVLVGGMTFSVSSEFGPNSTSPAIAAGGGADYWFSRRLGVQVIEVDYLHNNNSVIGPSHADFRISTGIVFRFGH